MTSVESSLDNEAEAYLTPGDPRRASLTRDPYDFYARLRARDPVYRSPDGRWLASCTLADRAMNYHFWRVATWELDRRRRIDLEGVLSAHHWPVFTRDGRLMALGITPDQVLLAEAATGRECRR